MASQGETFCCSICRDLLKDPVTIPCGHSYCMSCIKRHWDYQQVMGTYTCPECRKTFKRRPVLEKNIKLADLMVELKKTGLKVSPAAEMSMIQQRIQDRENDMRLLQQEVDAINWSADKAVEHSAGVFFELHKLMEKAHADVMQQVRFQQQTDLSRVRELQEKLQQEISELKKKDTELQKMSHTQDNNQFLSALCEPTHSRIKVRPLRYFEDFTTAVSEVREEVLKVLREGWTKISQTVANVDVLLPHPEPTTRAEFLKCFCDITLDPNTAHTRMSLSEGDRKVTHPKFESYPDHPDRFTFWSQVLSRESLTGRCYWEVERKGEFDIAVSYVNICRTDILTGRFGRDDKSCVLYCNNDSYTFVMNGVETPVPGPWSNRIGVYLDHGAGILSFYSVSKTMTLLYRIQTTFTQPLYAGLGIHNYGSNAATAEFCKLK